MSYTGPFPLNATQGGTGEVTLTNNGVIIGKGTAPVSSLVAALNGQLIIGNTGNAPTVGNLTSIGGTITISNGPGTINLEGSGGGGASSFPADAGTATEAGGVLRINGDASNIFTSGSSNIIEVLFGPNLNLPATDNLGNGNIGFGGATYLQTFGNNVFLGQPCGNTTLDFGGGCTQNIGIGFTCLTALTEGFQNTGISAGALNTNTTGNYNVAIGPGAMGFSIDANQCVGVGYGALSGGDFGDNNTCVGFNAGTSYATGSETNNICIGSNVGGVNGENTTTRLGAQGQQTACFIGGITGVTVASSAAVLINTSTGQLGTVASSVRYKDNIEDMNDKSNDIYSLRPVTFTFKSDPTLTTQYGLIAEEVNHIYPDLVNRNAEGDPDSVQYHNLPIMMLNELQKLRNRIIDLEERIDELQNN